MKRFRTLLCLGMLSAFLLIASESTGQDKKADPAKGATGPDGQAFMEKMVGDFNVVRIFYGPTPNDPKKSNGTCKQSLQYGGKFLISDFVFGDGPNKIMGFGAMAYVPETGLFMSTWFDSRQAKMSVRQSKEKFNGKQVELATIPYKLDKSARASRTLTTFEDNGKKLWHRQWNMIDDKEQLWMELHMTRK